MKNANSILIPCLQTGANNNYTRKMIEIGIPRELAIALMARLFKGREAAEKEENQLEEEVRTVIKENADSFFIGRGFSWSICYEFKYAFETTDYEDKVCCFMIMHE